MNIIGEPVAVADGAIHEKILFMISWCQPAQRVPGVGADLFSFSVKLNGFAIKSNHHHIHRSAFGGVMLNWTVRPVASFSALSKRSSSLMNFKTVSVCNGRWWMDGNMSDVQRGNGRRCRRGYKIHQSLVKGRQRTTELVNWVRMLDH